MKAISKHVFFPLLEKRLGFSTIKRLAELEKSQWLSPDELRQLQEENLRRLLIHAYRNVPYYQRIFMERNLQPEDIRTIEDLKKLPILRREDVRRNFDELIARNVPRKEMEMFATGGTTGEPLRFYHPKDRGWSWGAYYRAHGWYGYKMGDKHALIWSHPFEKTIGVRLSRKISQVLRRFIFQSAFDMSERQLEVFVRNIKKFKPKALIGYPSAVYVLAEFVRQRGIQYVRFGVAITTAEKLFEYQRQLIKETFDCDVFEQYGGGEVLSIAYECPEHHGYHITAENVVLEFMRDGEHASPGETGSIVVTDLRNYVMPFIRYENGDLGIPSDRTCDCGRGLPLMESVEGRITDVIVYKDGFISSPILTTIFKKLPIKQYQVIQESLDDITIKIIPGGGYSDRITSFIVGTMRRYLPEDVEIRVEFVDTIPLTSAGKRRVVISKVPFRFSSISE